jgi:hypothetical protein
MLCLCKKLGGFVNKIISMWASELLIFQLWGLGRVKRGAKRGSHVRSTDSHLVVAMK